CRPYRRKNLYWLYQTIKSRVKEIAKAPKPRIAYINSAKVRGTSSDTTSSVIANPNTASLSPSVRETSWLRQRNFLLSPTPRSINFSRSIVIRENSLHRTIQALLNYALQLS